MKHFRQLKYSAIAFIFIFKFFNTYFLFVEFFFFFLKPTNVANDSGKNFQHPRETMLQLIHKSHLYVMY